jgi:hypothetical protein
MVEETGAADGADQNEAIAGDAPKVERKRKTKETADGDLGPPMKLDKDYRPMGKFWLEDDDEVHESTDAFENNKVKAGKVIRVPIKEARRLNDLKLATRCDDF